MDLPYFLHIPKCGGKSVRSMLSQYIMRPQEVKLLNGCIRGHMHFLDSAVVMQRGENNAWTQTRSLASCKRLIESKKKVFTVIRHPLSLLMSLYNHSENGELGWENFRKRSKFQSFNEFLRSYCDFCNSTSNGWLLPQMAPNMLGHLGEASTHLSIRVVPLERLSEFTSKLSSLGIGGRDPIANVVIGSSHSEKQQKMLEEIPNELLLQFIQTQKGSPLDSLYNLAELTKGYFAFSPAIAEDRTFIDINELADTNMLPGIPNADEDKMMIDFWRLGKSTCDNPGSTNILNQDDELRHEARHEPKPAVANREQSVSSQPANDPMRVLTNNNSSARQLLEHYMSAKPDSLLIDKKFKRRLRSSKPSPLIPIQYWSQGSPLPELKPLLDSWQHTCIHSLGIPPVVFNKSSAKKFITKYAPDYLMPFNTSLHYAQEADVFRIAFASVYDCLWIDIDTMPSPYFKQFARYATKANSSILAARKPGRLPARITNMTFVARRNCEFFKRLSEGIRNKDFSASARTRESIAKLSGPSLYTSIFSSFASNSIYTHDRHTGMLVLRPPESSTPLILIAKIDSIMSHVSSLPYKKTSLSWLKLPNN